MSVVKQIVCLANARKGGERCIAGKELLPDGTLGGWIRPVSRARQDGALSLGERRYLNGEEPALLDVIELRVDDVEPADFQRENWTLGRDNQFKRVGLFTQSGLASGLDSPEELWINGHDAPSNRKNSRVPIDQARAQLTCSLYLIEVDNVRVTTGHNRQGREIKHGEFRHGPLAHNYKFDITDPLFEEMHENTTAPFSVGRARLTVSLTPESGGYAYKLIAAVMPQGEA